MVGIAICAHRPSHLASAHVHLLPKEMIQEAESDAADALLGRIAASRSSPTELSTRLKDVFLKISAAASSIGKVQKIR
jgi:hypothetical protein